MSNAPHSPLPHSLSQFHEQFRSVIGVQQVHRSLHFLVPPNQEKKLQEEKKTVKGRARAKLNETPSRPPQLKGSATNPSTTNRGLGPQRFGLIGVGSKIDRIEACIHILLLAQATTERMVGR